MQADMDFVVSGRWRVRGPGPGPGSYLMAACPGSDQVVLVQSPATFFLFALSDMRLGAKWVPRATWCSLAEVRYVKAMDFGATGMLLVLTWFEDRQDVVVVDVAAQRRLGTLWAGFQPDNGNARFLAVCGDMVAVKYRVPCEKWDDIRIFRRDTCAGPVPSWTLVRVMSKENHWSVRDRCLALSTCGAYLTEVGNYCFSVTGICHMGGGGHCFFPPDWKVRTVVPYQGHWIAFGHGKYWHLLTLEEPQPGYSPRTVTDTRVRARARPLALACIPGLGLLALERGAHLKLLQTRTQNACWSMSAFRCAWMGAVMRMCLLWKTPRVGFTGRK